MSIGDITSLQRTLIQITNPSPLVSNDFVQILNIIKLRSNKLREKFNLPELLQFSIHK